MAARVIALPETNVLVRSSGRARRLSLRVSSLDGKVTLTVPLGVRAREAERFVQERRDWIASALRDVPEQASVRVGGSLPVFGEVTRLVAGASRGVRRAGEELAVPAAWPGPAVEGWLKQQARAALAASCDRYAADVGKGYAALSLRDVRSRWGSCTSTGRLMFSWRLAMAPRDVLDYVAAHEVAHLAQMNHGPQFWAEVERIHGPYTDARRWLRAHGAQLHRYSFGD
ncbi:MAG: SprT family zinc-dependent metalloprotease [Pseudomonadota bacterium]